MPARLNTIIAKLERGETVCGRFVNAFDIDQSVATADLGFDFALYDMEHTSFNCEQLRIAMQFLLDRRKIAGAGSLQPHTVPLARVPTKAGEPLQWLVKQALDQGTYGLVVPHMASAEQARIVVDACRYATPANPTGQRGCGPFAAARYWGMPWTDYVHAADVWPLAADGELFVMPIIESLAGMKRIAEIVEVEGIGGILFGPGDLAVEMGVLGQPGRPELEEALKAVQRACRNAGVACAVIAGEADVARRIEEGFEIVVSFPFPHDPMLAAARSHISALKPLSRTKKRRNAK